MWIENGEAKFTNNHCYHTGKAIGRSLPTLSSHKTGNNSQNDGKEHLHCHSLPEQDLIGRLASLWKELRPADVLIGQLHVPPEEYDESPPETPAGHLTDHDRHPFPEWLLLVPDLIERRERVGEGIEQIHVNPDQQEQGQRERRHAVRLYHVTVLEDVGHHDERAAEFAGERVVLLWEEQLTGFLQSQSQNRIQQAHDDKGNDRQHGEMIVGNYLLSQNEPFTTNGGWEISKWIVFASVNTLRERINDVLSYIHRTG